MSAFVYSHPGENLLAALTPTVATGTVASSSSLANLQDGSLAKGCVFNETSIELVYDLGSAVLAPVLFLGNWNLSGATVTFRANDSSDFSSPAVSDAIAIPALDGDGRRQQAWLDRRARAAYRYVSLKIEGNATSVFGGEIWLASTYRAIEVYGGLQSGAQLSQGGDTVVNTTGGGVDLTYARGVRTDGFSGTVRTDYATGVPALQAWGQAARWRARPFPIVWDSDLNACEWARWAQDSIAPRFQTQVVVDGAVTLLADVPVAFSFLSRGIQA